MVTTMPESSVKPVLRESVDHEAVLRHVMVGRAGVVTNVAA